MNKGVKSKCSRKHEHVLTTNSASPPSFALVLHPQAHLLEWLVLINRCRYVDDGQQSGRDDLVNGCYGGSDAGRCVLVDYCAGWLCSLRKGIRDVSCLYC